MSRRVEGYRNEDGTYGYWGGWLRLCKCGHPLAVHVAGGFDCLNENKQVGPECTGEPCDCTKFRPVKKCSSTPSGITGNKTEVTG